MLGDDTDPLEQLYPLSRWGCDLSQPFEKNLAMSRILEYVPIPHKHSHCLTEFSKLTQGAINKIFISVGNNSTF